MTLKLTLKPGEGVLIGNSRIEVLARGVSTLIIDGDAPVLRSEYALDLGGGFDLSSRLRLVLQKMYLSGNILAHHEEYFDLTRQLLRDFPDTLDCTMQLNRYLMAGDVFLAIKYAKENMRDLAPRQPLPIAVAS